MKKSLILIGLLLFSLSSTIAFAQNKGAKDIVLNGGRLGNVTLTHQLHQDRAGDCLICHTHFSQKQGALGDAIEKGILKKKQIMTKTCIKCHKDYKKAGKAFGPTKCSGCHIK